MKLELSMVDWLAVIEKNFADPAQTPTFREVCNLAISSPLLHHGFSPESQFNGDTVSEYVAQHVLTHHGIGPLGSFSFQTFPNKLPDLIDRAKTERVYYNGLKLGAGRVLNSGKSPDKDLKDWLVDVLLGNISEPKRPKGPDQFTNVGRDRAIRRFLSIIELLNYPISEGEATFSGTSACHAIADAWKGNKRVPTAKRLMNIWAERN